MSNESSRQPATVGNPPMPLSEVRERLGELWGLKRPITRAELARALRLSPKYGDQYIQKLERGDTKVSRLTGSAEVAILMMLAGATPPGMESVVVPGYPRGAVR